MYMMVGTFSKEYWKAKILKHNIFYYKYKTRSLLEREYCILYTISDIQLLSLYPTLHTKQEEHVATATTVVTLYIKNTIIQYIL